MAECTKAPNLALGILSEGNLGGWVGIRPLYGHVWEIHPLVVGTPFQGRGLGTRLLREIEARAKEQGLLGLFLGTDDETFRTSLSAVDLTPENVLREMAAITDRGHHPFEFYRRNGYAVVGVVPDANGPRKPDILMWKRL